MEVVTLERTLTELDHVRVLNLLRRGARADRSPAQAQAIEQDYKRTVIAAYEEVENALVNLDARRRQREELHGQVEQLEQVAVQTEAQLNAGLISQLEVFETERSLLAARLALPWTSSSRSTRFTPR